MNDFSILDCTFRDGGYYNNWQFPPHIIQEFLSTAVDVKVNCVEIGFRFLNVNETSGHSARCEKGFIESFNVPNNINLAIMFNASDLALAENDTNLFEMFLGELSPKITNLNLIRIACHVNEYEEIQKSIEFFKENQYKVALNLMQISEHNTATIKKFINFCNRNSVDLTYFADSLGSLLPKKTNQISELFHKEANMPFGIHAHDNLGLALANSLCAIESGAAYVDASITGMGRGPGNTILEELIQIKNLNKDLDYTVLFKLIDEYFLPLKNESKWGKSPLYFNSGIKSVHPTYVQEISSFSDINTSEKFQLINKISRQSNKSSFSKNTIWNELIKSNESKLTSNINASFDQFNDKNIIVLGPNLYGDHQNFELDSFLSNNECLRIIANPRLEDQSSSVFDCDYFAFASPLRWQNSQKKSTCPIISPFRSYDNDVFFELTIGNEIIYEQNIICLPKPLIIPYLLGVLGLNKARNVVLFGFQKIETHPDNQIIKQAFEKSTEVFESNFFYLPSNNDVGPSFIKKVSYFERL